MYEDKENEDDIFEMNETSGIDIASAIGWQPESKYQKLIEEHRKKHPPIRPWDNLLEVRPANEWFVMPVEQPAVHRLFGDLWKEGELAIMFADTGTGKSILATQIAESLARGANGPVGTPLCSPRSSQNDNASPSPAARADLFHVLENKNAPPPQKVLYLDFEMSEDQFTERYSCRTVDGLGYTDKYSFSDDLMRTQINWSGDLPEAFDDLGDFMAHSVFSRVRETDAKALIVDNISWLATANTNASAALGLMKGLKAIKNELRISVLVLAHTPKRPIAKSLTVNDLAGSKMLANFADNIFAIGTSVVAPDLRYIKHIKHRNTAAQFDASNVVVCRLEKPLNFPQFTFVGFDAERFHTTRAYDTANADRAKLIDAAKELAAHGHTQRDIAAILDIGKGTVGRYLSEDQSQKQ